jgi:hypothetical protein
MSFPGWTRARAATLLVLYAFIFGSPRTARGEGAPAKTTTHALEGVFQIHQKFLFEYFIGGFGNGQECALFGEEKLKNIKPGSFIHVEGRLGTRFHGGGTAANPSPFPQTCYIYMDVDSVKVLREPEERGSKPAPGVQRPP